MRGEIKKDEWGVVLDFLPHGRAGMSRSQPVAQVLGDKYFSLLEVIVRDGISMKMGDRVYIGDKKRNEVKYILGRIKPNDLTAAARDELELSIENIIAKNEELFLQFINECGPITTRMHQLELLPGIGKKHLWAIIEERKLEKFKSFDDMKKRVPLISDPRKMIAKRIMDEIEESDRYSLFVLRTPKPDSFR